MLDVNVIGLSIVTRESVALMRANNVDDGHVININSVLGHVMFTLPMYTASKFAVTALTEGTFKCCLLTLLLLRYATYPISIGVFTFGLTIV